MTTQGSNRSALVAGAGSGIGRATALRLSADHTSVTLVGRRAESLQETADLIAERHPTVSTAVISADLEDPRGAEEVRRAVTASSEAHGPAVHSLVNAVGGYHVSTGDDLAETARLWAADWSLNVLTTVLLLEAVKPALVDWSSRVVAVSSVAAVTGVDGPYSSAKAGLHGWARGVARELAPRGITVNVVAPGYVEQTEFFGKPLSDRTHARLSANSLTGRATAPDQIAEAVAWLVDDSSGQVTGQVIAIDGGHTLMTPRGPE